MKTEHVLAAAGDQHLHRVSDADRQARSSALSWICT